MEDNKHLRYRKTKCILGEGSYKTVSKAIDEEEGKEVAYNEVKIKYEDDGQMLTTFSKEIALLKSVDHPNIIKIVDYWFSEENFIFITELMTGGSLKDYIQKHGPLSTKLIRKWGKQILEGLKYLHSLDPAIIHRDIKSENIFVNTAVGDVKIGDLGLAREKRHKRYTIVGTPHFMAREMFEGDGYTEKVDVYAFGMVLVEMATGRTPYGELKDTTEVCRSVMQGILPRGLEQVNDACLRRLIMGCLAAPEERETAGECLSHHFFQATACGGECNEQAMELSVISVGERRVIFQILVYETMKFIKFEYDLDGDTVKKVCDELLAEQILGEGAVEEFSGMLEKELGIIEERMKSGSLQSICFGEDTLEEMRLIEESMKVSKSINNNNLPTPSMTNDTDNDITSSLCSLELTKSVKFKNEKKDTPLDLVSEDIYSQFPNASFSSKPEDRDNFTIKTPPISSPPFGVTRLTEEQAVNDISLSESYEMCRVKYKSNYPITQYALDAAAITGRTEDTAKSWIKALRDEDIETVFDLKLMVYEDWEMLPLTVFSCRAMQNMLYGIDGVPPREKQLPLNPKMKEYDNRMSVKAFLEDICETVNRKELVSRWEDKLLAQDIQTVGELKSLHHEDWSRLSLSVYAYRILKNVIFRKGKILIDYF